MYSLSTVSSYPQTINYQRIGSKIYANSSGGDMRQEHNELVAMDYMVLLRCVITIRRPTIGTIIMASVNGM